MKKSKKPLTAINSTLLVSSLTVLELAPHEINKNKVGTKAAGLASLPYCWTLPYFVISSELFLQCSQSLSTEEIVGKWFSQIEQGIQRLGLSPNDNVLIRSSAVSESMEESGKFLTMPASISNLRPALIRYLQDSIADSELKESTIFLVIQKAATTSLKGHLSNERHCSEEARDWQGQIEKKQLTEHFSVNLRNWRNTIAFDEAMEKPLLCNIALQIQNALKYVAAWGKSFSNRLHFEWVWDGKQIYIVQANEETPSGTYVPLAEHRKKTNGHIEIFSPLVLKPITRDHAKKYSKIHNVYVYMDLGLSISPLFILDSPKVVSQISEGVFSQELEHDLKFLAKHSLIIRTDLNTDDQLHKQMLPRTSELRSFDDAKNWLIKNSKEILDKTVEHSTEVAFIFHNFIPATASAFAFSAPGERKVQIESLWGIPEGLYYNSHDKYTIDTLNSDIKKISNDDVEKFKVKKNINHKPFCVAPMDDGSWQTQKISAPYDWRESIGNESSLKEMAFISRRIAEKEGKSVSIMWFVGLPTAESTTSFMPWFHEPYNKESIPRSQNRRRKTPLDKHINIRTMRDFLEFEKHVEDGEKSIRQILVQPIEEGILRDKLTLKKIGELAKRIDAVILLEGATLSHAFYQLIQTGAAVHIKSPFDIDEDIKEFNKLVRDEIPSNIERGGESVLTGRLEGEALIKALREKLVEEALEVLDAKDHDSVLNEISDVLEVIDALAKHLGAKKSEIEARKQEKRKKAGGFDKGLILIETGNPSPSSLPEENPNLSLDLFDQDGPGIKPAENVRHGIKKWADRRSHHSVTESILSLEIPLLLDAWEASSQELTLKSKNREAIQATIQGTRLGAHTKIEISFFTAPLQLDFLE
jgi:predicted house-cleaning noncanonical NTP pyrophosphatase (MazG superfamily)